MGEGGQTIEGSVGIETKGEEKPKVHGPNVVISHGQDGTLDLGIVRTDPQAVYRVLAETNPQGWLANLADVLRKLVPRGSSVHSPEEPKPESRKVVRMACRE